MTNKLYLGKYFGVGPFGLFVEVLIWFVFYKVEIALTIPPMPLSKFSSIVLLLIFIIDALYLIIGGNYYLIKYGYDKNLIDKGPYQFVRHPVYGAAVFSFTGIVAVVARSWGLIISVIPITLVWSWLVTFEENVMLEKFGHKYQEYMSKTGQFLPSWRAMKENLGEI